MKYLISFVTLLLILIFVYGVATMRDNVNSILGTRTYVFPNNKIIASWLWKSPLELDTKTQTTLFSFAAREHINTVYVDISDVLDMTQDPIKKTKYDAAVTTLLTNAKKYNITVQGLAGDTNWSDSDHKYIAPAILQYVLEYNQTHSTKFSGMQWDIEFYNDPSFKTDQKISTQAFLELVQILRDGVVADPLAITNHFALGFTMPYWADGQNNNISPINWSGKSSYVGLLVIDELNQLPSSYIALMSYRNHALGDGGSIAISKNIVSYASTKNVGIIIGQETSKVSDTPNISYFGTNKQVFKNNIHDIINALSGFIAFKGIAIHHLESYQTL